jgi:hypothetical protein
VSTRDARVRPSLRRGDLVTIRDAGAYAGSLASTYNGRRCTAQILSAQDDLRRIRLRGRGCVRTIN